MKMISNCGLILPILIALLPLAAIGAPSDKAESQFPLGSDDDCWKKLPPTTRGGGQALPSWARALASTMPRTTAALLRLDLVHRTNSPLDPRLRAKMRWVAAHANHCAYAEAYAAFDAARAGLDHGQLERYAGATIRKSRRRKGSHWSSHTR